VKKSFLRTKTVHGVKTGNHSNPNVLRAARASGGSCMVEGASARPSMSKPKMMRGDGGGVEDEGNPKMGAAGAALTGAGAAKVLHEMTKGSGGSLKGKLLGAGMTGLGLALGAKSMPKKGVEKSGMAEDGKEDRKNGGGIMPRFKAKKTDKDDC
jgi:hypothetical protein